MKCPKCGFIQGPREECKKCGKGMNPVGPEAHPSMGRLASPASSVSDAPDPFAEAGLTLEPLPDDAPDVIGDAISPTVPEPPDPPSLELATPVSAPPPPVDAVPDVPSGGATDGSRKASFHGSGGPLFVIHLVNGFLTMITMGIYVYWAKVKVRRYLLGQAEFEGDRFEFHGTGKELLRGWGKAMLIFFVPFLALGFLPLIIGRGAGEAIAGLLQFGLIIGFMPLVFVSARRYRMSRTSWRGIRFSFRGPIKDFVKLFFKGTLLNMVTLGLYSPIFHTKWHDFMTAHTYFGSARFEFDGNGKDLYRPFLIAVVLLPFTLGISWIWYRAATRRYYWDHTTLGDARFRCTVTGGELFSLYLTNAILFILTLGFAYPWVQVRVARFHLQRVSLEGPLDLARIQQEAQSASASGEELAGFFDMDLGWA